MSKLIAVTNSKGGVSKSTTAINLAAIAAEQKKSDGSPKRVLLIDLDQQGPCTHLSGVESTGRNAAEMFQDEPALPSELAMATPHAPVWRFQRGNPAQTRRSCNQRWCF